MDVVVVVFPAAVVVVVVVGLAAAVVIMLVDTKIITIARTEIVVAIGWLLLFLSFRCVKYVSCPNTSAKAKKVLVLFPCSPYDKQPLPPLLVAVML